MKYLVLLFAACAAIACAAQDVSNAAQPANQTSATTSTTTTSADSALLKAGYALLHVYRGGGAGFLIDYDLHLGDTVICRVSAKSKTTIRIKKKVSDILWAKTEAKEELPITIEPGHAYYIRCGMTMGAFVGHPSIRLMDAKVGKAEFAGQKVPKGAQRDVVFLKSGTRIECLIQREDDENIYCTIFKNDKTIDTRIVKSTIESIERREQ